MTIELANIQTRAQWHGFAAETCRETYVRRRDNELLEEGAGLIKSYVIEAHKDVAEDQVVAHSLFKAWIHQVFKASQFEVDIRNDVRLFWAEIDGVQFLLDAAQERYWQLLTNAQTKEADRIVRRLFRHGEILDQVWMPTSLQYALQSATNSELAGAALGFGRFSLRGATPPDGDNDRASLGMRISGSLVPTALEELGEIASLRRYTSIYRTVLRTADEENLSQAAISTVWYNGKLTLRGNWYDAVSAYPTAAINIYRRGVGAVDSKKVGLRGRRVQGSTIRLTIPNSGMDLQALTRSIAEMHEVFRLMFTRKKAITSGEGIESAMRLSVVDLHTAEPFTASATQAQDGSVTLHLQLRRDVCGNIVPRLLANIQQFVDAEATCPVFEDASARA